MSSKERRDLRRAFQSVTNILLAREREGTAVFNAACHIAGDR